MPESVMAGKIRRLASNIQSSSLLTFLSYYPVLPGPTG
jgi:hypothetical protein